MYVRVSNPAFVPALVSSLRREQFLVERVGDDPVVAVAEKPGHAEEALLLLHLFRWERQCGVSVDVVEEDR